MPISHIVRVVSPSCYLADFQGMIARETRGKHNTPVMKVGVLKTENKVTRARGEDQDQNVLREMKSIRYFKMHQSFCKPNTRHVIFTRQRTL
jgi:hypothetical protein